MVFSAAVTTALTVVGTATQLMQYLNTYGVAIEIDNFFRDVNVIYQEYYVPEGGNDKPPKETISKGTKNTAGAYSDYSFTNDGCAGSIRYTMNNSDTSPSKRYCLDIIWSQDSWEFVYRKNLRDVAWWSGYGILIGDESNLCSRYTVQQAYELMRDAIKGINDQYMQTGKVAERNSYIWWNDGLVGAYEKRGLNDNAATSFPRGGIDVKVGMGAQSDAELIVEVGPTNYWTQLAQPHIIDISRSPRSGYHRHDYVVFGLPVAITVLFILCVMQMCYCLSKNRHRYGAVNVKQVVHHDEQSDHDQTPSEQEDLL